MPKRFSPYRFKAAEAVVADTALTATDAITATTVITNANLTGDVTSVGNATTLATVATAGTTGSSTAIPVITINVKGLTTNITTAAVVAPAGTLSGTTLASGVIASSLTSFGTSPIITTPIITGFTDGSSASSGKLGEVLEGSTALGSASLSSGVLVNAASISLTAGDWEISGTAYFLPSATTTVSDIYVSVGTTSVTANNTIGFFASNNYPNTVLGNTFYTSKQTPNITVRINGTTTYYLVARADFAVNTCTLGGIIHARRLR